MIVRQEDNLVGVFTMDLSQLREARLMCVTPLQEPAAQDFLQATLPEKWLADSPTQRASPVLTYVP